MTEAVDTSQHSSASLLRPSIPGDPFQKIKEQFNISPKEWTIKWDKDIKTMSSLRDHAASKGYGFMVQGGYAVEVHCGGIITRPHQDMDLAYLRNRGENYDQEHETVEVESILGKETHTKWKRHEPQKPGKIDIREVAPGVPFEKKRMIEIGLGYSRNPNKGHVMKLYDSQGQAYEFNVEDIGEMVANKVRMLIEKAGVQGQRPTKQQDIDEIQRLVSQPHFNQHQTLMYLSDYYKYSEKLSDEEALKRANETWIKAFQIKIG